MRLANCALLLLAMALAADRQFAVAGDPQGKPKAALDRSGDPLPAGAVARLGTVRWRPGGSLMSETRAVNGMALLQGGKQAAVAGRDGVSTWNLETGRRLAFAAYPAPVPRKRFTPRSNLNVGFAPPSLCVASEGGALVVFRDGTAYRYALPLGDPPVALGGDGDKFLAVGSVRSDTLFAVRPDCQLVEWRATGSTESWARTAALAPPDKKFLLATGGSVAAVGGNTNGDVRLWDAKGWKRLVMLGTHPVHALAVSGDGKWCAACFSGEDREGTSVTVWRAADGEVANRLSIFPRCIALSPDGTTLAAEEHAQGRVGLYDVKSGKLLRSLPAMGDEPKYMAFVPDGSALVALGSAGVLRRWDTKTGKPGDLGAGHTAPVRVVRFLPDGRVASAGADGVVRLWDGTGKELRRFEGHARGIVGMAVARDGKTLFTAGGVNDDTVRAWDVGTAKELRSYSRRNDRWEVFTGLDISADGKTLVIGLNSGRPRLLDAETLKEKVPPGPGAALGPGCYAVAFAGKLIVWRDVFTLRVEDAESGKEVCQAKEQCGGDVRTAGVAASPDGKLFAAPLRSNGRRFEDKLGLWEVKTGKLVDQFTLTSGAGGAPTLTAVAFTPDGNGVVVGDSTGGVWVVDIATKAAPRRFEGHKGEVLALAVSADGKKIASGAADATVLIWNLDGR
jgi:WD40 repeat protein